jgi:uncharacterized protein (DUF2236 family)
MMVGERAEPKRRPRVFLRRDQLQSMEQVVCAESGSPRPFSPESTFWRENREVLLGLSGARALMMELAHPLVAAAVAQHSNFRTHPLGRIYRTMRVMADLTFGHSGAAREAARHVNRCHRPVIGALGEQVGPFAADTRYAANDPALKLWVLATLIDSSLLTYDLFVSPLSREEKESYYRDSHGLARLLGIPASLMPASYAAFTAYMSAMLGGEAITAGETARQLVKALFGPGLLGRVALVSSFVSIGLLPERLRREYQFSWDQRRERRLRRLAAFSRRIRPLLPSLLCVSPKALWVEHGLSR